MAIEKQLVDLSAAKTFIDANWPNDPLLRHIVLNLLDRLPRVEPPKWIPVTERLPKTERECWEDEDGSKFVSDVSEWLWGIDADEMQVRVRYESGPDFRCWYDDNGTTYGITHWMPLPAPPQNK